MLGKKRYLDAAILGKIVDLLAGDAVQPRWARGDVLHIMSALAALAQQAACLCKR